MNHLSLSIIMVAGLAFALPIDAKQETAADAPFKEFFGNMRNGTAIPNFTVDTADGQKARLYDFIRGKPIVLAFWDARKGPGTNMLGYFEKLAGKYSPDLAVLGIGCLAARPKFDDWIATNRSRYSFPVLFDPAGENPDISRKREELEAMPLSERKAVSARSITYANRTIIGRLLNANGGLSPMPVFIVLDSEAKLVGALMPGADYKEAMGNLLARAGIPLAAEDKAKRVYTREETRAPEPERVESIKPIAVGSIAPDFTALDSAGKEVKLSDYRGKVVLLDFWATWCGPCLQALPHVDKIAAQYKRQDLVVLAVCTRDKRGSFEAWHQKNREKYPHILFAHDPAENKPEGVSQRLYGVKAIPRQFIINREGRIVDTVEGYIEGEAIAEAALAKAGLDVDAAVIAKGRQDLIERGKH